MGSIHAATTSTVEQGLKADSGTNDRGSKLIAPTMFLQVFTDRLTGNYLTMKIFFTVMVAFALLAGCATQPTHTATNRPEVTISGARTEQVKRALVGEMLKQGYIARGSDPMVLAFERDGTTGLYPADDGAPFKRIHFTVLQLGTPDRPISSVFAVVIETARESDASAKAYRRVQSVLDAVKHQFESGGGK